VDLRFADLEEKRFVVQGILQQLYKFLVQKGGSEKLRYVLYMDELAGFLPPPPGNPPSKRLLELLIRQSRAFGLGIILATQSPGDIDYRIMGNLGTRFIGKLRTERDIEKVSVAMGVSPSQLTQDLANLSTGDFIFNDAVRNTMKTIHARWLFTYHAGPLTTEQIGWVNGSRAIAKSPGKLVVKPSKKMKKRPKRVKVSRIAAPPDQKKRSAQRSPGSKPDVFPGTINLRLIIEQVERYADSVQTKAVLSESKDYSPHLRVVIEPKGVPGLDLPLQGPYVFDLTTRMIPLDDYLKGLTWSLYADRNARVALPKQSIRDVISLSVGMAQKSLHMRYHSSPLAEESDARRKVVAERAFARLKEKESERFLKVRSAADSSRRSLQDVVDKNLSRMRVLRARFNKDRAGRLLKRIFSKKVLTVTKGHQRLERELFDLKRANRDLKRRMGAVERRLRADLHALDRSLRLKAEASVVEESYSPKREDLIIHATVLLVPKGTAYRR
jgi:hypothetical protein